MRVLEAASSLCGNRLNIARDIACLSRPVVEAIFNRLKIKSGKPCANLQFLSI